MFSCLESVCHRQHQRSHWHWHLSPCLGIPRRRGSTCKLSYVEVFVCSRSVCELSCFPPPIRHEPACSSKPDNGICSRALLHIVETPKGRQIHWNILARIIYLFIVEHLWCLPNAWGHLLRPENFVFLVYVVKQWLKIRLLSASVEVPRLAFRAGAVALLVRDLWIQLSFALLAGRLPFLRLPQRY